MIMQKTLNIPDNSARRHHFLSQCYLKGFTPRGRKTSKLVHFKLQDRKTLPPTSLKNLAQQRDFYRIEIEGLPAGCVEALRADFEAEADNAIRNVESAGVFEGEDKINILKLMARFATSNPYNRAAINDIQNFLTKRRVLESLSADVGKVINENVITPDMIELVRNNQIIITNDIHQNKHIHFELSILNEIIELLLHRKWQLVQISGPLTFITCDRPVVLAWKVDAPYTISPGFASLNSQVCFPLTKKLALVGSFDGENGAISSASDKLIGWINTSIFCNAGSWVYAETEDFCFAKQTGELAYGKAAFWEYFESVAV